MAMTSYRAFKIAGIAILAIGIGQSKSAQFQQTTHNIEWYSMHPYARDLMLKKCHSDMAFSHSIECQNSEQGSVVARGNGAERRFNATPFPRIGSRP